MSRLFVFGLGYSARRIKALLEADGWLVAGTTRSGGGGTIRFDDDDAIVTEIAAATHILSSVPPEDGQDPVLAQYGEALMHARGRLLYLSSTGVYGDTGGAWVDETAPTGTGRRSARAMADARWLELGASVFRLPGIYGPGRSPLDRIREGKAHRVDMPDQVFSRIHVDDLARGVIAGLDAPAGAYNIADDFPASHDEVTVFAAGLLGLPTPPFVGIAELSPMAQGFYAENRRIATGKVKRVLGWQPQFADYRAGLRALSAMTSPTPASAAPAPASSDQR